MAKKKEVSKKPVAKEKKGSGIKKYFRSVVSENEEGNIQAARN